MSNILSQEEVDVLLKGLSGGEIDTERTEHHEPGDILPYDLTSQDRIIRGLSLIHISEPTRPY